MLDSNEMVTFLNEYIRLYQFPLCVLIIVLALFIFFQAEDGIRYIGVTGVQTCALPISARVALWSVVPKYRAFSSAQSSLLTRESRDSSWIWAAVPVATVIPIASMRTPGVRPDRKSVVQGKSVDLGGRRIIKKTIKKSRG